MRKLLRLLDNLAQESLVTLFVVAHKSLLVTKHSLAWLLRIIKGIILASEVVLKDFDFLAKRGTQLAVFNSLHSKRSHYNFCAGHAFFGRSVDGRQPFAKQAHSLSFLHRFLVLFNLAFNQSDSVILCRSFKQNKKVVPAAVFRNGINNLLGHFRIILGKLLQKDAEAVALAKPAANVAHVKKNLNCNYRILRVGLCKNLVQVFKISSHAAAQREEIKARGASGLVCQITILSVSRVQLRFNCL